MEKVEVYSLGGEYFTSDLSEIVDEISQEKEALDGTEQIFIAEKVTQKHSDYFNVKYLIEDIQNRAYENTEFAEEYLEDGISKESLEKIESEILNILDKHFKQPTWFFVKNVKEVLLSEV